MSVRVLIAEGDDEQAGVDARDREQDRIERLAEQVARYYFDAGWVPVDLMAIFEDNRGLHIDRICGTYMIGSRDIDRVWKRATRRLAQMHRDAKSEKAS